MLSALLYRVAAIFLAGLRVFLALSYNLSSFYIQQKIGNILIQLVKFTDSTAAYLVLKWCQIIVIFFNEF